MVNEGKKRERRKREGGEGWVERTSRQGEKTKGGMEGRITRGDG